jgi:hypothetical protein
MNHESERLKALFRELKRQDASCAPPFEQCVVTAQVRRPSVPPLAIRIASLCVVLLGIGGSFLGYRQLSGGWSSRTALSSEALSNNGTSTDLPWRSLVLASQWQSPTDFLLDSSADPAASPNSESHGSATLAKPN